MVLKNWKKFMKIGIEQFKNEIVRQILISQLCFDICGSVKIIPGRGNDFLPYYYNLNFIKGLLSLHSLLLSREKDELSINNFINEYKINFAKTNIGTFETQIEGISKKFSETFPMHLRHKIGAHLDKSFTHVDFTSAYIMPSLVTEYIDIAQQLKNIFLNFFNYAKNDCSYNKIKQQSDMILKSII